MPIALIIVGFLSTAYRPNVKPTASINSSIECPTINMKADIWPFFAVSLIVTVRRGPGIMAPESATTNAVEKILISSSYAMPPKNHR
jgi:hypothetical protein